MDFFDFPLSELESLVLRAFAEDFAHEDLTSLSCVGEDVWTRSHLLLKQDGCIAGLRFIPWIFQLHDPRIEVQVLAREGEKCRKGTVLAQVYGPARSVLSAERVALNFLQHLTGVATLTALCVEAARGTGCRILDTRKTLLGLRNLQKYAVRIGGGMNHRLHLADRILIKNTHLILAARESQAPLLFCIGSAKLRHPGARVEVEIGSPEQVLAALDAGADAILLDNMTPNEVREAVRLNQKRAFLEASGGITLATIADYAATGVDGISIGALTHSAPALDISLRIG